ncbi:D-alanyl-D-alanine carboxypeptidase/D-alanyl-D-alanine endopeptidase [Roseisalinus antarcticus]|uniref:D-alanyl-D-alanine carboxypeptidase DacB n=1 Tax=Roseisalinus antarcticus TaxID=254357 RepID=A0A1Y5T419_9RHOB|nr:D-alanyl-D-alanine carboxypeptidase/D-alanyl-D-alanine-endopeptidase [Roseisalinus antarcticus]SLN51883.1 D-alanyl-D-alanine carboxypeptidase DacB precursor [Roseisalinus antarcticus]
MRGHISRRTVLGALASALGTAALADAPLTSLRPRARPSGAAAAATDIAPIPPEARATLEQIVADARLEGTVSIAVADTSGRIIEGQAQDTALPPASVTKSLTALYALETVGPEHRFVTRLIATGPVTDGRLDGDIALVGGGDPTLETDHLFSLAAELKAAGIREVTGRFLVYGGALPYEDEIDEGQLDHLGYNPAVSGLNLNYNRVHFEWARTGSSYRVTLDARSATYRPEVTIAEMRVADRSLPVYTYAAAGDLDQWTVARGALGDGGSRWLPVRRPALYCGDVFRTFARSHGIVLPAAEQVATEPTGSEVARHSSGRLQDVIRDMLRYSTNLTAEVVGLTATASTGNTPPDIPTSAAAMNLWLEDRFGVEAGFVDHSGLGDASRISAAQMVGILTSPGVMERLMPVLKEHDLKDAEGAPIANYPATVHAKTGTLNFVSALAGFIRTAEGADVAFAIFCGDLDAREAAKASGDEIPAGSRYYNGRARNMQQRLLQRWGLIYTG